MNAITINRNAILFNTAQPNLSSYAASIASYAYTADMTSYVVKGDILRRQKLVIKTKKSSFPPIFIIIIFLLVVTFPWWYIYLRLLALPNPPRPTVTYGEFPFKLVYEINGEEKIIEDTLICKFDGFGVNEASGKYRKWKSRLAKIGTESILLVSDDKRQIYCYIGDAEYYMGDEKYPEKRPLTPRIYPVKLNNMDMSILSTDELLEKYKIKLISWTFTEPIKNEFW